MSRWLEALSLQPMAKRRKSSSSSSSSRSSTSVSAGSKKIRSKRDRKLDRTVHLFSTVLGGDGITREEYLALTIAPRVRARVRLLGGDVTIDSYCVIPGLVSRDPLRNLNLWKCRFKKKYLNRLDLFQWMETLEKLRKDDFVEHGRMRFGPNDEIPTIDWLGYDVVTGKPIAVESALLPSRDLFHKTVLGSKYYVNVIDRSRKRRQRRLSRKNNDTLWVGEYERMNDLYSRWLIDRILLTTWDAVATGLCDRIDVLNRKNHNVVRETYKGPRGRRRRYRRLRERLIARANEDTFNLNAFFANSLSMYYA